MKKQFLVITGLFLFSLTSFAQVTITPYVQGDFSHYILTPSESDKENASNYKDHFKPKFSYTFGVNAEYSFNEKWSLQTGLMFQEMGEKIPKTDVISFTQNEDFIAYKITHHYQYINIPIQAKYKFSSEAKFSPYIAFGSAINFNTQAFLNSTIYDIDDESTTTKIEFQEIDGFDIRTINLSAKTDIGFNYQLTEKLNLNTFLSGNILLLTTNKGNSYNARNFNIGLGVGVGYSI